MPLQSHQSMPQRTSFQGAAWTQTSIAIKKVAEHYNKQHKYKSSLPAISSDLGSARWYQLYRFATKWELCLLIFAVLMAFVNGFLLPVGNIIYGEFTGLLIDRTVRIGTSTKTLTLEWFGGGKVLTNASKAENRDALKQDSQAFALGVLSISFVQFIAAVISVDLFNYTALKQMDRIKEAFLRALLRQDITWYDLNTSMNFATKVSDDVERIREGIAEKVPIFIYLMMSLVASLVIALIYGWKLTLVVLATTPITMVATLAVGYLQSKLASKELDAYSKAGVSAEEVLTNIRTVVAFGGEEKEITRYSNFLHPAKRIGYKKGVYSGFSNSFMWLMIYASYSLSFWYGVKLILADRHVQEPTYNVAVLMLIFLNLEQGALNVGLTIPHLEAMAHARASAGTMYKVMDRKPEIDSLSTDGDKPVLNGEIELVNVHFSYPSRRDFKVLNGLDLKIAKGEMVALIGHSGCGKSTVLQLIQRLYDPDSGEVLISGNDVKTMNVRHLRNHIAVVGQEPVLFAGTIKENIRMSNPSCSEEEIIKASKEAHCHGFIKTLPNGYDTMIGERGAQLSGGQKQRIAIARALVRKPMILLLDEATSALDSHSEAKVQKALDEAAVFRTTVIVSHRLSTVLNADRIVYLEKGLAIEQGTHSALLKKKGHFYRLVMASEPSTGIASMSAPGDTSRINLEAIDIPKSASKIKRASSVDEPSDISLPSKSESSLSVLSEREEEEELKPTTWQVLKLCSPEKYLIFLGVLASAAVGSTFPMFAILFGEVYGILESRDEKKVMAGANEIAFLFLGVGIFIATFVFVQIYLFNLTGVRLTARLRVAAFKAMLAQEMGWFDSPKNAVGALCARLAFDAAAVQGATGTRIGALMCAFSTILIGTIISLYFTWSMTLVSVLVVPLIMLAVVWEARLMSSGATLMREASNKATIIATEAISNIKTVCAFCGEENILARYREAGAKALKLAQKRIRLRGIVFGIGQTMPMAGYAGSLWYGGNMVANEEIHYKEVIKVSECMIFGALMMGQALAFAPNFGAALEAAGRVMSLLRRKPRVRGTTVPSLDEDYLAEGKIFYEKIFFRYPTRPEVQVLRGLSLNVPAGKQIALVGPSGCGKSTLIQLLQRLYDPDKGNVYLDDYSTITDISLVTLRRNLSIVSQEPVLFDRSIADNIAYGDNTRIVTMDEIIQCAVTANIHKFVTTLPEGYDTRIGSRASQLSGGQKQRIAIARALIRNPRILLLDEATSALDAESEKVVQEALDRAVEDRTCIIIAHRLSTIVNSDIIFVIDKGEVVEMGTHEELLAFGGLYEKLYELQYGVTEDTD